MMNGIHTTRICTLMVTHACNLRCTYCFEKHKSNDSSRRRGFETAKAILSKELDLFAASCRDGERFAVEFFGGEPLLNFPLIESVYDWVKGLTLDFPVVFQITTNGTLLTPQIRTWLTERKADFRVILSVDGTEVMQARNRGCDIDSIPISFVRDTWEKSYFKMTLSRETLPDFAVGVISLTEHGYRIASSPAEGIAWQPGDDLIYKEQLEQIGRYYLEHPEIVPEHPFNFLYKEMLDPGKIPVKSCGVGTSIVTYDIDGRSYPCHLFLPVVHGREEHHKIAALDFSDPAKLVSEQCVRCPLRHACRTCYGYNYLDRGDIARRNPDNCRMQLAEARVVSAFEINYLMQRSKHRQLTDDELLMLKAAVRCYQTVEKLKSSDLSPISQLFNS